MAPFVVLGSNVDGVPLTELLAGIFLVLLVALAVEFAEVSSRLKAAPMRYRDRVKPADGPGAMDRFGGVALAAAMIWFFALPWVAKANLPVGALVLFLAMFIVGVALLSRLRLATVRYPLATFGPLMVVAGATAMT